MRKLLLNEEAQSFLNKFTEGTKIPSGVGGVRQVTDDNFIAFDSTSGEIFVEEFGSALEATTYAMGQPGYFKNNMKSC